jgi:hypothetical protein
MARRAEVRASLGFVSLVFLGAFSTTRSISLELTAQEFWSRCLSVACTRLAGMEICLVTVPPVPAIPAAIQLKYGFLRDAPEQRHYR